MSVAVATWRYKGLSAEGRIVRGEEAAANENDLHDRLAARGLHLIAARAHAGAPGVAAALPLTLSRRVPPRELLLFTLHLEQLAKARLPILDCLAEAEAMSGSRRLRRIAGEVRHAMEHGASLSQALARRPAAFDSIYVGLIAAGEASGDLLPPLSHIAQHLKWREETSRRIRNALRYPLFALLSALASLVTLLVVVVPELSQFLKMLGGGLPWQTRLLLGVSAFVAANWQGVALGAGAACLAGLAVLRFSERARRLADRAALALPLAGPVLRKTALSRFSHFTAILFRNGVGLLSCLAMTERLLANRHLAAAVRRAASRVESGWSLADALADTGCFPRLFLQLARAGEQGGDLAGGFETIRDFYDRDAEDALARLTANLQPAMVALVGLMLLWVVVAVIGPVYGSFATLPL